MTSTILEIQPTRTFFGHRFLYSGVYVVRGLMAVIVGCEFRARCSIPSVCRITDADLGQVG